MEKPPSKERHPKLKVWRARIAVIALCTMLLFAAGRFWLSIRYSDEALISQFYVPIELPESVNPENPLVKAYDKAHTSFQAQQYKQAITQFQQVRLLNSQTNENAELRQLIEEGSRFNFQLARLADGALDDVIIQDLRMMAQNSAYTHHERAEALIEKLQSRWRPLLAD